MTDYDLREFQKLRWVRFVIWFGIGLRVFVVLFGVWFLYGSYLMFVRGGVSSLALVGIVLISWIWAMFLFLALTWRGQATSITLNQDMISIKFERGGVYARRWESPKLVIRGRKTEGAADFISAGQPLRSVYGRWMGLTESWIPAPAFRDLVEHSRFHGMDYRESRGRAGWVLYVMRRR
ncbi:MAG: hypothetical protein WBF81_07475 [Thermoplasmata archaeon]